jgi:radical SAM protein with 4Fe4S-binding SPASM domain
MYFRLNPECFLIDGKNQGAIYDLIEGTVYSLNPEETIILRDCEKNLAVDPNNSFLSDLEKKCLGTFYENQVFIEKLRIGSPIEEFQPGRPPQFSRAFLEINNTCERTCRYCGFFGIHRSMGCMGCNIWDEPGQEISIGRWKNLIHELEDLDCKMVYFTGGDLTKDWERTLTLIDHAEGRFRNIFVCLKSDSLSGTIKKDLAQKATPIVQTDKLEEIPKEDPYVLTLPQDTSEEKMACFPQNGAIEFLIEEYQQIPLWSPLTSKKKIPGTSVNAFYHNKKAHPCLGNSLAITWRGDVLPCLLMRKHVLGNIQNMEMYSVFQKNIKGIHKFWEMHLGSIEKCEMCEFRYTCMDCRALEESLTGNIIGKALCNYDPTTGHWL